MAEDGKGEECGAEVGVDCEGGDAEKEEEVAAKTDKRGNTQ